MKTAQPSALLVRLLVSASLFGLLVTGCSNTHGDEVPPGGDTVLDSSETVEPPSDGTTQDITDPQEIQEDAGPSCPPVGSPQQPTNCPCVDNGDCDSGYCVQTAEGKVCTETCITECPVGWICELISGLGADSLFLCVPKNINLCRPCEATSDCADLYLEQGERCVRYGAEGNFCGVGCDPNAGAAACPAGFQCNTVTTVDGEPSTQCISSTQTCDCTPLAIQQGASTACSVTNGDSTCEGKRSCQAGGLSACDAVISDEVCDGLDNNCDGTVDGMKQACTSACGDGEQECVAGQWSACVAGQVQQCMDYTTCTLSDSCETECPAAPAETCNGTDDNCNDTIDEGFACKAGDSMDQACPQCGTQVFTCTNACEWEALGACVPGGVCSPGETDQKSCGQCGVQTRSCDAACGWGEWSDCMQGGACAPGDTETMACGNCGTSTRTCTGQCMWGAWTGCSSEGACAAGAVEEQACGNCGKQTRSCSGQCQWGAWTGCGGQGVCAPLQENTVTCGGNCATQTQVCTSTCQWGPMGACIPGGQCTPGQSESMDCGLCGNQTRTCTSGCAWTGWGACQGQGVCNPNQSNTQACGQCGTQSQYCQGNCQWGGWLQCGGQGVCTPGQVETQTCPGACGGSQQRTCNGGCQWGAWSGCSGGGVCTPGELSLGAAAGCDPCSLKVCGNNCQWGACQIAFGNECEYQGGSNLSLGTAGGCDQCSAKVCQSDCKWSDCSLIFGNACEYQAGSNWKSCGQDKWQFCSETCQYWPCQKIHGCWYWGCGKPAPSGCSCSPGCENLGTCCDDYANICQ